jgi:hypothetical protein
MFVWSIKALTDLNQIKSNQIKSNLHYEDTHREAI